MPVVGGGGRVYIGIDPGANGAVGVYEGADARCYSLSGLSDRDLSNLIAGIAVGPKSLAFAVIERVGGYIGINGIPSNAMFNFGMGYGKLLMALTCVGIPFEEITPQTWQKGLGIPKRDKAKGETQQQFKRRLKAKAESLFPEVNVTLTNADALLIALYCKRKQEGTLER